MKRRHLLLVFLIPAALLLSITILIVCYWPPPHPPQINWVNANRIKPGMTRTDIEAILGPPNKRVTQRSGYPGEYEAVWESAEVCISVWFHKEGARIVCSGTPEPEESSLWKKFKALLGLQ